MSRYYDHVIITFSDGTVEEVGGNRSSVHEGVLKIWTDQSYGGIRDHRSFPLAGIRSWHWKDGQS